MLDDDELMYTRILNHNATPNEITDYIDKLYKEIENYKKQIDLEYVEENYVSRELYEKQKKEIEESRLKIKDAKERIKREKEILDELLEEEYNLYGRSSEYELYSEQLDTLEDIETRLK